MNNEIQDAVIVSEAISAEESALANKVIELLPQKNYGLQASSSITESVIKKATGNGLSEEEALAMVSCLADAFSQAKEILSSKLAVKAANWPESSLDAFGVVMTRKEVGVKYYYDENDEWKKVNAEIDKKTKEFKNSEEMISLNSKKKGIEAELKAGGKIGKYSEHIVSVKLK